MTTEQLLSRCDEHAPALIGDGRWRMRCNEMGQYQWHLACNGIAILCDECEKPASTMVVNIGTDTR